jgi:hypothetical protein
MKIYVTDHNGIQWKGTPSPPKTYNGWRCLHQAEGGYPNPDHMPVVRPSLNIASVPMNRLIQLVSFKINQDNIRFTGQKWRATYNGKIAFTNRQGFDDSRAGPRADFVNLKNIFDPLPKLMNGIICGGEFYTGKAVGNKLVMTPGVDAIDSNKLYTNIDEWAQIILDNHWYFHAVTRAGDKINNFPQGEGGPVLISFFLPKPAEYPLDWFEKWVSTELPDPLKIYHPL